MKYLEQFSELETRFKIPTVLAVLLLTGFLASNVADTPQFSSSYSGDSGGMVAPAVSDQPTTSKDLARSGSQSEQAESGDSGNKVVTTVRMTLKVSDVDLAMGSIKSEVRAMDGFVESSSRSRGGDNTGRLTVAVPSGELKTFESDIEKSYSIKSRDVDRNDVTDTYNELETEIESLQTEHQRLQELINQTDEVKTLIKLQERLSTVRSQINYKQQRLDRLKEEVEYSKVYITLEGPQSFESKFDLRETFSEAYTAIFDSFRLIVVGAAYLVPFALIYAVYRAAIRVKDRGF